MRSCARLRSGAGRHTREDLDGAGRGAKLWRGLRGHCARARADQGKRRSSRTNELERGGVAVMT